MDFGTKRVTGSRSRTINTSRIIDLVKGCIQNYSGDDNTIEVMVTELECTDPDCVPLETLVALLGKNARWTSKILKPLSDVTLQDVEELPLPVAWSAWVNEYALTKDHSSLLSWIYDTVDDFEDKIGGLSVLESDMAILIFERTIRSIGQKLSLQNQEISRNQAFEEITTVRTSGARDDTIISASIEELPKSTLVTMKMKSSIANEDMGRSPSSLDNLTKVVQVSSIERGIGDEFALHPQMTAQADQIVTIGATMIPVSNSLLGSQGTGCEQVTGKKPAEAFQTTSYSSSTADADTVAHNSSSSDNVTTNKSAKNTIDSSSSSISRSSDSSSRMPSQFRINSVGSAGGIAKRHNKGTRPRGCPCCDPDNIDNIVDKMLFFEAPP